MAHEELINKVEDLH